MGIKKLKRLLKKVDSVFRDVKWKSPNQIRQWLSSRLLNHTFIANLSVRGSKNTLPLIYTSIVTLIIISACGPATHHYAQVNVHLVEERYEEADKVIEDQEKKYGKRNLVLYDFDRALTLHLAGRYKESNGFLERAENRIDELYTKSITSEISAMFTNDNRLPYEGEDFEKVMVNILGALNYVYLGEWDEALVEGRKVDLKLNLINDRYEKKNIYKEDAFARYLSGILFESQGELNDAFIAYRKAFEAYRVYQNTMEPPSLHPCRGIC